MALYKSIISTIITIITIMVKRAISVLSAGVHWDGERTQRCTELSSSASSQLRPRTVGVESITAGASSLPQTLVTPVQWTDITVRV